MSRLPLQFAGKNITWRIPYNLSAEFDCPPNTFGTVFPDAAFMVQIDKPFEIHRVFIDLIALGITSDSDGAQTILEPQPTTMSQRVRLLLNDLSKNEKMTRSPTLVNLLLNKLTGTWEFEEPYTLVRSENIQVIVDTLDFPNTVVINSLVTPESVAVLTVRVVLNWQGYVIVIAPPSETR